VLLETPLCDVDRHPQEDGRSEQDQERVDSDGGPDTAPSLLWMRGHVASLSVDVNVDDNDTAIPCRLILLRGPEGFQGAPNRSRKHRRNKTSDFGKKFFHGFSMIQKVDRKCCMNISGFGRGRCQDRPFSIFRQVY